MGLLVFLVGYDGILVERCCEQGARKMKKCQTCSGVIQIKWRFHKEGCLESGCKDIKVSGWRDLDVRYGSWRLHQAGCHDKCNAKML